MKKLIVLALVLVAALTGCSSMGRTSNEVTTLHGWVVASDSDALTLDVAAQGLGRPLASHTLYTGEEIASITCSNGSAVALQDLEADDELEIDARTSGVVQYTIVVTASAACS